LNQDDVEEDKFKVFFHNYNALFTPKKSVIGRYFDIKIDVLSIILDF